MSREERRAGVKEIQARLAATRAKKFSKENLDAAQTKALAGNCSATAMEEIWRTAWGLQGTYGYFAGWTIKQKGQAKQFRDNLAFDSLTVEVLAAVVLHWEEFMIEVYGAMGWQIHGKQPSLGVVIAAKGIAIDYTVRRLENEESGAQTFAQDGGSGWGDL